MRQPGPRKVPARRGVTLSADGPAEWQRGSVDTPLQVLKLVNK